MKDAATRTSLLKWLLAFTIASTTIHYTHNFIAIDKYPGGDSIPGGVTQAAIVLSWPVLTAIALWGYRLYKREDYRRAVPCLIAYSFLGLFTIGHFAYGVPDIPAFFFITIFTDFIGGAAILAFAIWTAWTVRRSPAAV